MSLSEAKSKRGIIKAKLTRAVTSFNSNKGNKGQLRVIKDRVSQVLTEFETIQEEIELLSPDNKEEHDSERTSFENQYYAVMTDINNIINPGSGNNRNQPTPTNPTATNQLDQHIYLPKINLPSFDGSLDKFLTFHNTFDSLIHQNQSISEIQKFHYLRSCLSGEASRAIESMAVTTANYNAAWDLLIKRYHNTRLIVNQHVLNILYAKPLTKGTQTAFRDLIDDINVNIEALKVLQLPVNTWDALLVPIISEKFDYNTKKEWQSTLNSNIPQLTELIKFLERKYEILESMQTGQKPTLHNNTTKLDSNKPRTSSYIAQQKSNKYSLNNSDICPICNNYTHLIQNCRKFLAIATDDKIDLINKYNLCTNCLRANHKNQDCTSKFNCQHCNMRHHSLLHNNLKPPVSLNHHYTSTNANNQVLLSTCIVLVKDSKNKYQQCRCLLDQGSQSCMITKSLCDKLQLKLNPANCSIGGIAQNSAHIKFTTGVTFSSMHTSFHKHVNCLVLDNITNKIPSHSFLKQTLDIPTNIPLADPNFNLSNDIDILLGAEIFYEILETGTFKIGKNQPHLQNTKLGWIIGGAMQIQKVKTPIINSVCNLSTIEDEISLNRQVARFWETEAISNPKALTIEDSKCERHFTDNTVRDIDGRFVVKLPQKEDFNLGLSKAVAQKRFYNLERKLNTNPNLKSQYVQFMSEFITLQHMELVPENETTNTNNVFYLPHHAVFKPSCISPKIRIVFDGSAKSTNGLSLNDNLLVGPTIQQDLFCILIRFRTFNHVLNADISKMYRQVKIAKEDADLQRIFWRENPDAPLQTFRLTRVTYGTASAAFLAIRCLHELAIQHTQTSPMASAIIKRDFYVDDLLTGADTIEEALILRDEITSILAKGGFELRKWNSNTPILLPDREQSTVDLPLLNLEKNAEYSRTLGLVWNSTKDCLKYEIKPINDCAKITKREILSQTARLFDPLGQITPVIIRAKILLQTLWTLKLEWDDVIPHHLQQAWNDFRNELPDLTKMSIPRKVIPTSQYSNIELHGFCDSSERAFGAAFYIRTTTENSITTQLLCSKSRVAPLKQLSIPRLELCSAHLMAELHRTLTQSLNIEFTNTYLWTDSQIVISWIKSPSKKWKTFVANRVGDIQTATNTEDWLHVSTIDNPSDLITRGMTSNELLLSNLWWHGPSWLCESKQNWPDNDIAITEDMPEERSQVLTTTIHTTQFELITKYSNLTKLKRITAYILRFIYNSRHRARRLIGPLTTSELNQAANKMIKIAQREVFEPELKLLKTSGIVPPGSKLQDLAPFLDNDNLIRVGGRLQNTNLSYNKKHPMVIPKQHHLTDLIIRDAHEKNLHAGPQATLAAIRNSYWPLSGRSTTRRVLRSCVKCFRAKPTTLTEIMGNLPVVRTQQSRPFLNCGVDYFGPLMIKEGTLRTRKQVKAYVALFICMATKAIHMELVYELTTRAFLNALKRFIARRGHVAHIYSDNAGNFRGANTELSKLKELFNSQEFNSDVINSLNDANIQWHFIPPRTPNFAGIWESGVKSTKHHLKRVAANASLNYEEMYTLLTTIEAILNSRPLTPMSNDPNDLASLTPAHFLIGDTLNSPVEPNLEHLNCNRLSRYQHIEQLRQHFWRRWSREYLSQLHVRGKWTKNQRAQLNIGTMVVLKEDNLAPLSWPLGRITQLHPGRDGKIRVVTIKTASLTTKRGINKLCVLPITDNNSV